MKVNLLSREEIDKSKWNSCVHFANNGNVFGYKWYLDAITKDWEGLVEEGYGSVFPLIWKKNWWGSKKIYQPELMLEGGIYSENILSAPRIRSFIEAIPKKYKSFNIHISNQAKVPSDLGLKLDKKTRRQLILNQSYEGLSDNFTEQFKSQLVKAQANQLQPASNLKPERVVDFYKAHAADYKKDHYFAYLRIMYNAMHRGWGFANGINNRNGDLLAVVFFIYSHGKILILLPVNSLEGQQKGAMELLLSMILQTHANKPVVLDFNGFADIGLGSQEQVFYQVSS
ncbi:MAG: hypothetical protein AAF960_11975 [Bacteroidota bacterium]